MLTPGRVAKLKVLGRRGSDLYLGSETTPKIALMEKELPPSVQVGDDLEVFVYIDADGSPAATLRLPLAQAGDVAWLKVAAVNYYGAFLEWGLAKDLLVPSGEQPAPMQAGKHYLVKVFLDANNRVLASARLDRWLSQEEPKLRRGEPVSLVIADRTDLGVKAAVNHRYWGLLYQNELFQPVKKGQKLTGYVKQIRPDRKLDITLQAPGYAKVEELTAVILARLAANNGFLPLNDNSPPERVYQAFGVSKKVFKQAMGALYRQKRIVIEKDGISLAAANPPARRF